MRNDAKAWLLQSIAKSREGQRAYHQTVVREIRTEIKEQELLMDQLEEKRSQLSRDLARHQHAEGA